MNNWKVWIENLKEKPFSALGVLILLAIPVTLILVFRSQDTRSSAAAPDKLETEAGVLTSTGVNKQNDSAASGGQYVVFNQSSSTTPTPTSAPSSGSETVYGAGIAMDTKSNVRIGTSAQRVAVSFRASKTGQINSVAWQRRNGEGYSLGDCGIARIFVQPADSNGRPSGSELGSLTYDVPCDSGGGLVRNTFPSGSRPSVTAGQMYVVAWENIHSNPSGNYWSVNKNLSWNTTPVAPGYPDHHVWQLSGSTWSLDSRHSLGFDVAYAGGGYDGLAYHNTMLHITSSSSISGNNMLREQFTVEGQNRVVNGVRVRVNKQLGSSPLIIGIYENSTLLRSVTVPYTDIVSWDTASVGTGSKGDWEGGSFSPLTLVSGRTYYVKLSTNSGTQYTSIGIHHTQDNSTDASSDPNKTRLNSSAFREGRFERSTNGGSSWSNIYSSTPGNMQMYFTLQ